MGCFPLVVEWLQHTRTRAIQLKLHKRFLQLLNLHIVGLARNAFWLQLLSIGVNHEFHSETMFYHPALDADF